jgi:short-subunit dehydrogenase
MDKVYKAHGELDLLFNNAGIAVHGTAHSMTLEQWNRCLDVNVRGVVNGVMAAYPRMVTRGSGHIINTASLAGLAPAPLLTVYSMSKFAVRGMSESLRYEAERYGVRVSAVCPGMVQTPIVDNMVATSISREEVLSFMKSEGVPFYDVSRCANQILRGVQKNRALIVITPMAKVSYWFYRHFPRLHAWFTRFAVRRIHRLHREDGGAS